jgi:hypothetical protein
VLREDLRSLSSRGEKGVRRRIDERTLISKEKGGVFGPVLAVLHRCQPRWHERDKRCFPWCRGGFARAMDGSEREGRGYKGGPQVHINKRLSSRSPMIFDLMRKEHTARLLLPSCLCGREIEAHGRGTFDSMRRALVDLIMDRTKGSR